MQLLRMTFGSTEHLNRVLIGHGIVPLGPCVLFAVQECFLLQKAFPVRVTVSPSVFKVGREEKIVPLLT